VFSVPVVPRCVVAHGQCAEKRVCDEASALVGRKLYRASAAAPQEGDWRKQQGGREEHEVAEFRYDSAEESGTLA